MARIKPPAKKIRLARMNRRSRAVPAWVIAKTKGKTRTNKHRRNWRQSRIKV
ncbi:50S ribosomal protein L39e [Candidatus Bathyarchaeota archaeon]|nr:50S ribosomal protein L39e [Candidatus Bathyarchaeota archaeon]